MCNCKEAGGSGAAGVGPTVPGKSAAPMNTAEDGLPLPQRYWAILTLVTGLVVSVLDSAIANIALPTIAREIGASPAQSIWVINAYQLAIVVSLLPLASLGDIFGYRRIYVIGLAVFSFAALVSALSHSLAMLALGRALQGLGAAGMTSVNIALVRFTYPRRQLGRGIAMTAVAVSISSAAGPTVASAILAFAPWPWLFAIDVPIGLVTLGLSLRLLPYTPPSPHRFDLMSALLSAVASALLVGGITGIGHGQGVPVIVIELSGAIFAGYVLARRQAALSLPLLPVDLFRRPVFALSVTTSVCTFVALGVVFVTLPFYFQYVLGRSQVETGLLMTPWPATVALVAPFAGRLADRYPAGILCGIGLAVLTSGFVLLAALPAQPHPADIVWRMMICGFGFGFFGSPNNRAIITSAPRERSGGAGAIQSTARLLGQTIGAALVALIFGFAGPSGGTGPTVAILLAACFSALAAVLSVLRIFNFVRGRRSPRRSGPVALGEQQHRAAGK
jgi:MFS transporter, DHA2 family, multidrug resistance protein